MLEKQPREHDVGYGKPPEETRFKPGQSGNPKGRPKGAKGFRSIVREALSTGVTVHRDGATENVSAMEALILKLLTKGMAGEPRAMDKLIELARAYDDEEAADAAEDRLSEDDAAILARFKDRLRDDLEAELKDAKRAKRRKASNDTAEASEAA